MPLPLVLLTMINNVVTLLLVRHGESVVNAEHKVPGHSLDSPLTPTGHLQAQQAARIIKEQCAQAVPVYCSDAERAHQTALAICRASGPRLSALLREQDMGTLEGRLTSELRSLDVPPGTHISEIAWGGAESLADVYQRMCHFLTLIRYETATTIVIVGHADCLRVLEAVIAGVSHRDIDWNRPGLAHGEVRKVVWRR